MSYYNRTTTSEPFVSSRKNQKWQRNQNTVAFASKTTLGPIAHTVLVALMIAVLGLIYLSQVTKTSTFGYTLQAQTEQMLLGVGGRDGPAESRRRADDP